MWDPMEARRVDAEKGVSYSDGELDLLWEGTTDNDVGVLRS